MTKKEVLKLLKNKLQELPKYVLLNLFDSLENRTPKLWCEPSEDCFDCKFPEGRVCDEKDCTRRASENEYLS